MGNFDITSVWTEILDFFNKIYRWMILHGITVGNFRVSYFSLGISLICLTVLLYVVVPWFTDDDAEGTADIGYYDDDDDD